MAYDQWLPVSRRGGGEFYTQDRVVPAGVSRVNVKLDVDPAEFPTPDLSLTLILEASTDGGSTWHTEMAVTWRGGVEPHRPDNVPVGWLAGVNGLDSMAGQQVRVHFVTIGTFRWGLLGEMV